MSRAEPVHDPRIAKKEMIVTRFKSAQQRKQQGEKEQGTKKQTGAKVSGNSTKVPQTVTKTPQTALKLPIKVTKMPETVTKLPPPKNKQQKKGKPQKSPQKPKEKIPEAKSPILIEDDTPEYYPEKLKRAQGTRKVFLKPKQKSTMIARTNKRKFNTPKRGIKSPLPNQSTCPSERSECQSPVYSELSMAEVIRIVEENDSLDDEDLMEILTCPSPVWWEEPPDEMYIEEAICSRKPEEIATGKTKSPIRERCLNTLRNAAKLGNKIQTQNSNPDTNLNDISTEIKQMKKDDKFIKKSKKLENVLGNIKSKASNSDLSGTIIKQEELDDATSLQTEIHEKSSDIVGMSSESDVINETIKNDSKNDQDNPESSTAAVADIIIDDETTNKRKTKKLSESTEDSFGDLNCRNQELLFDLENMNIPIADNRDVNSPDCVVINDDNTCKIIDIDALDDKLDHQHNDDNKDSKESSNTNTAKSVPNKSHLEQESKGNITQFIKIEESLVPKNMPPLIKRPKFENPIISPNSYKSISDDVTESSSISGIDMMDTISDTNIKFITDDDIDDGFDCDHKNKNDEATSQHEVDDSKQETNENSSKDDKKTEFNELAVLSSINDPKSKDSYITVYKIVPNDERPKNKFKNIPEYSSYVENLMQTESKTETAEDSLENEIPDIPADSKGQLISFFKKCKNANRKRKRIEVLDKVDTDKNDSHSPKKSITVAHEENVKYCLKCSAIFDTEDCSYCLKNQKDTKTLEKSFTCDKCDFVGDTKSNVNVHLEEHNIDNEAKT
ncbi:hypothetical protein ABMA28_012473 [Loxostege sticticalis]|uniref:C2H2-type domain-containing protein n=1 Tax=Loxostege sticticalis TaxID=481309 RepID=A0ABD0S3Y9_LOXSC